jgi:hypothetical protein
MSFFFWHTLSLNETSTTHDYCSSSRNAQISSHGPLMARRYFSNHLSDL